MLRALREFLKCRGVLFNSKTLDTGEKAKAWVIDQFRHIKIQTNKGDKFLKKLWCCVGGSITR